MKNYIYKTPEVFEDPAITKIMSKIVSDYLSLNEVEMKDRLIDLARKITAQTKNNIGIVE